MAECRNETVFTILANIAVMVFPDRPQTYLSLVRVSEEVAGGYGNHQIIPEQIFKLGKQIF